MRNRFLGRNLLAHLLATTLIAAFTGGTYAAADKKVAHAFAYKPDAAAVPKTVHVAGDFNDWSTTANPMVKGADGRFTATVELDPGQYVYKFVFDGGERWVNDPAADKALDEDDGHGGVNSGLLIREPAAATAPTTKPTVKLAPGEQLHTFTYRPEGGRSPKSVHVAGEFNNWSMDATPLTRGGDGAWAAHVKLSQGTYLYKFVVDGDQWVNDTAADKSLEQDDGNGGKNSGVAIGKDSRHLPPPKPNHVNLDAVYHDPADPQDVNVVDARRVLFRVRAQAGDVERVELVVHNGAGAASAKGNALPMSRVGSEHGFDVFGGLFDMPGHDVKYGLHLIDGTAKATPANLDALRVSVAPQFVTPDWAKHAVWYQIFPERFRNGDTSNDPEGSHRWQSKWFATLPGEVPGVENFYNGSGNVWKRRYGGDIQGIRTALPYLRKLGINAIYLNPIFEAESMHKYDTTDFRHVDDNFGAKGDLARLSGETDDPVTWKWTKSDLIFLDFVQEARRQGFKVIIDGVFNHVGTAHPFFQDVLKNGRNSKYADWFEITD